MGEVANRLGAGRRRPGDAVNHGVGVELTAEVGEYIHTGAYELDTVDSNRAGWERGSVKLNHFVHPISFHAVNRQNPVFQIFIVMISTRSSTISKVSQHTWMQLLSF